MRKRLLALICLLGLVACPSAPHKKIESVPLKFPRGGLVRVGMLTDILGQSNPEKPGSSSLDPAREYTGEPFEILRCCLTRTLFQYSGKPTNEGGTDLRPDLATGFPDVSSDGLTWTFHIKKGIHYAPPLANQEVVAEDFVTALKRVAIVTKPDAGDYSVYYSVIRGFDEYMKGRADSISGIATPDAHTLVFTLIARDGDFADRFVLAATSPIPTLASSSGDKFGVATGHNDGYGHYLVSTGPYMLLGSDALTPGAPASQQKPAAGFVPGTRIIKLVRNPSWDPATDPLRAAYADRIDIHIVDSPDQLMKGLGDDTLDVIFFGGSPSELPLDLFHRYQSDPSLGRTLVFPRDSNRYVSMNLAVPPFDDVHVRRAANLIVDKHAYIATYGGLLSGTPATHINLDSFESDQLVNYDPYRTSSRADALAKAKAEMRLSKYDSNHDGICDAPSCRSIEALAFSKRRPRQIQAARSVAADLALIGVQLRIDPVEGEKFFMTITDPSKRIPIGIAPAWIKDYFNGSQFMLPLFAGPMISTAFSIPGAPVGSCCNFSLVGASPSALRRWGYTVDKVPSADDRINQCLPLVGRPQTQCWTALDQYFTETIVPWVPLLLENGIDVIPARVVNFSLDQFTTLPSLDQIVVQGSSPTPSPS